MVDGRKMTSKKSMEKETLNYDFQAIKIFLLIVRLAPGEKELHYILAMALQQARQGEKEEKEKRASDDILDMELELLISVNAVTMDMLPEEEDQLYITLQFEKHT
ncbi:hypothetical protein L6452_01175 [Arctium lappa]|uniref:Uncharacterized protein n=1 Tax=Arctium lappa TaxID=4217 RepID=A0ACB9FFK4_ARCLA|nr:hypothetical protein L6452_01175 [Arctium lappa]